MKNDEASDIADNSRNEAECNAGVSYSETIATDSGNLALHRQNQPFQESVAADHNHEGDHGSRQNIGHRIQRNRVDTEVDREQSKTNEPPTIGKVDTAASVLVDLTVAPERSSGKTYSIGTRTKKYFPESKGWFQGTIRSYNKETKLYSVDYEDNDTEELEHREIDTEPLPPNKHDIGTKYEASFWSKKNGKKMGWFVGTIKSKFYHDANYGTSYRRKNKPRRRGWRYTVIYSDGETEDVTEANITRYINKAKEVRDRQKAGSIAGQKETDAEAEPIGESSSPEKSKSLPDNSSTSWEQEESDEDSSTSSSSETHGDPNPEQIPYWTGKQHHQFITGLKKYGLGNLEDIHEANCIPSRSFQELVRYWHWYVTDMEEKGLVLNYEAKGTINGKKGRPIGIDNDSSAEEKKEEHDKNPVVDSKEEPKVEVNSEGFHAGKFTDQEVEKLAEALVYHGSSYKAMSDFMKTRSAYQISSYYNKNKKKIQGISQKYARKVPTVVPADSMADSKALAPAEHEILVEALAIYGHDYQKVESYTKHRTAKQIQGYVKRKRKALDKEVEDKKRLFKKRFPKKAHAWTCNELSRLVEGNALFKMDFKRIADYVKTRNEDQVRSILEANPSQYEDESAFDLGGQFAFAIELYHVLNIAPFEGFCHVISWSEKGDFLIIHDEGKPFSWR